MSDWIERITSAWKGHRRFAEWLVTTIVPRTIVELGVDYGYSSFVFANALKNQGIVGKIYGIDLFQGDIHTGHRNTFNSVMKLKEEQNMDTLEIVEGDFSDICKTWTDPIQILHIDGLHTYEAVKQDYENWHGFVEDTGVIIFHDVEAFKDSVGRFFQEINGGYKLYFTHSAGLGIFTKNEILYNNIKTSFPYVRMC